MIGKYKRVNQRWTDSYRKAGYAFVPQNLEENEEEVAEDLNLSE
jgi:hypothetical protein